MDKKLQEKLKDFVVGMNKVDEWRPYSWGLVYLTDYKENMRRNYKLESNIITLEPQRVHSYFTHAVILVASLPYVNDKPFYKNCRILEHPVRIMDGEIILTEGTDFNDSIIFEDLTYQETLAIMKQRLGDNKIYSERVPFLLYDVVKENIRELFYDAENIEYPFGNKWYPYKWTYITLSEYEEFLKEKNQLSGWEFSKNYVIERDQDELNNPTHVLITTNISVENKIDKEVPDLKDIYGNIYPIVVDKYGEVRKWGEYEIGETCTVANKDLEEINKWIKELAFDHEVFEEKVPEVN